MKMYAILVAMLLLTLVSSVAAAPNGMNDNWGPGDHAYWSMAMKTKDPMWCNGILAPDKRADCFAHFA